MSATLPILGKILSGKNSSREPFLALEISAEKGVKVAIWRIEDGKYEILAKEKKQFEGEWGKVISATCFWIKEILKKRELEEKVKKIIFGLPKKLTQEEKIKSSFQPHLKKLCQELSLTPLGFVEIPAAIAFLLKEKKGHPLTAILLKVGRSSFSFNVFKIGQEVASGEGVYKEDLSLSLTQAFNDLPDLQTFPTKIFLYDQEKDLEEARQELLSYPWQKEARFLHFPQIEILEDDFSLLALIAAGASEFAKEGISLEKEREVEREVSSQELGFLKDKDIAQQKQLPELIEKEEEEEDEEIEEEKEDFLEKKLNLLLSLARGAQSIFLKLREKLNLKGVAILLLGLGVFFLGGLFYLYWIFPSAKIKLFVEPYSLEKGAKLTLDLSISTLGEDLSRLPAKELVIERRVSEKIAVSSKKEVGDPARGEVTIYNKTTHSKTFPKGTVLVGPKGLKFSLDEEVTVASLSDVIAGKPGKEKAKVTAVKIGPEGNLGAGSDFTFEDFPVTSYAARNEKAFQGGTSREITVVGKKDQEELLARAEKKLTDEAKEELRKKLSSSEKLLVETIEGKILEKKFSHDVGEETDELSLDLTMSFKGISFNEKDLNTLLSKMVQESAPPGFKFDQEKVKMEVESVKKEKDKVFFNAHFKVQLTPEIKTEQVKKTLAGKTAREVEEYLRKLSNISGFELKFVSCPPLMRKTLPFNPQKISIEIETL